MKKNKLLQNSVTGLLLMMCFLWCGFRESQLSINSRPTMPVVGTLTAYYAAETFAVGDHQYKKNQLICDSNDPLNRIVNYNAKNYKYEGDDTGEYYSWLLPKQKVKKVTYTMNKLPASMIGDKATFKSKDGLTLTIFKQDINGHKYYQWDDDWKPVYNAESTKRNTSSLIVSVEFVPVWEEGTTATFEFQLHEKGGCIDLYHKNRYGEGAAPGDCRYRPGLIGFVEQEWQNAEGWEGPAHSADGKLLVDQYSIAGSIPEYCSIAYIADKDAIYYNGTLYYRQKS